MADGLRLTLLGAALGLVLAAALSDVLRSHVFQVHALSPGVYAAMTGLLMAVAGLACALPAARAGRVDPRTALRAE
jgi:putative ABC transport system permease protein